MSVLNEAGLETLVLKGAALSVQHYRDFGVRPMKDVDVLVEPERAREAAALLRSSGWTQDVESEFDALIPVLHGILFLDGPNGIDLHWHSHWAAAPEEDLWAAAVPVEVAGVPTLAQCPTDQLLHVCVHGIWSQGQRIRWVADAFTVLRSAGADVDWGRLVERARAHTLTLPLGDAVGYLRTALGAPVPMEVVRQLRDTPRSVLERAGHRAWAAPPTRFRASWLALERYRRLRALPARPIGARSLYSYIRCYASAIWGVDRRSRIPLAILRRLLRRRRLVEA